MPRGRRSASTVEERSNAVRPLFELLHEQGRTLTWLAKILSERYGRPISKGSIWNMEHGENYMPQKYFDAVCELINAPEDIRNIKLPVPLYSDYQKGA